MSVKTKHSNEYPCYFITFTCYQWMDLFEMTNGYKFVYAWFNYLKERKNANVVSYVIMPNHLHLILYLHLPSFDLNKIISNGKRFLAYAIIKEFSRLGRYDVLDLLHDRVTSREQKKRQRHRVFKESFDGKPIYSKHILHQKINYIHNNPVKGKWRLANDFEAYEHSSASFYETGEFRLFKPEHFKDLL